LLLDLGHGQTQRLLLRLFRAVHTGLHGLHPSVLPAGICLWSAIIRAGMFKVID